MAESLLALVQALKAEKTAELEKPLPVPLWEAPNAITLTVRPLEHEEIRRITARAETNKDRAKAAGLELTASASLVAAATVRVTIGDNPPVGLHDLDPDGTGASTVQALCRRDGDVLALAAAVMTHSGYATEQIDEVLAGE